MNKRHKSLIYTFFLIVLPGFALGQSLSKLSTKIKASWEELSKNPDSKQRQLAYLKAFPANKQQFIGVFQPEDFSQLYPGPDKYITSFVELAKYYPAQVIDKSINIGKDLVWDADATGQLQHSIVQMGCENVRVFIKKVKSLPESQTDHLIKFLADVENHKAYRDYQNLIVLLNDAGETGLANEFIDAKTLREKIKE